MKNQPVCPHCNEVHDIEENESYFLYQDDDYHEILCVNCNKFFWVKTNTVYTFSTAKDSDDL